MESPWRALSMPVMSVNRNMSLQRLPGPMGNKGIPRDCLLVQHAARSQGLVVNSRSWQTGGRIRPTQERQVGTA